ncbi:MAG: XTP/dITP diphosphatase [Parachlamydia sp.]|nr:XTP/dITP diphosphatase [Parachlamydia sp.]
MELVLASTNLHKIREFREMLKSYKNLDVLPLINFPSYVQPPETGATFEENAVLKAVHAAQALSKWVMADDSGLVVPSLSGSPGVYSARYAGEGATDADNRLKLLRALEGKQEFERNAYFECCLALANTEGIQKVVTGTCEGIILTEERGRHGFGYDPLFLKNDYDKTFGELEEATKNRISHRRKALEKLTGTLEMLLRE